MKKLTHKDIDYLLILFNRMSNYKNDVLCNWDEYMDSHGQYVIKTEIVAMWKLYKEYGIELDIDNLPETRFSIEEDENYDLMFEDRYKLEEIMFNFIFPSEAYLKKKGWTELEVYIDRGDYDTYELTEDEAFEQKAEEMIGPGAKYLLKIKDFFNTALSEDFYSSGTYFMKSERAGKYIEYAEKHKNIKRTKLHKQILECIHVITSPYEVFFPDFEDYAVIDGCVYAFTTGGNFTYSGEEVSIIHGKLYRRFCVEILDVLLSEAEEKYGYTKDGSL